MSNVTLLPPCCERDNIKAFDTGPGNVMIDIAMKHLFDQQYDAGGKIARMGKPVAAITDELMSIPFIRETPPKSTGREFFSEKYTIDLLKKYENERKEDIIHSLSLFTASTIAMHIEKYGTQTREVICSGGGAKNKFILDALSDFLPNSKIHKAEDFGIDSNAKEAIAFAFLAVLFATDKPGNVISVTGADEERVLGSLSL
jgi:anhydro-N-acetylmuramic acid kinase